jgi:hypothetical protein
MSRVGRMARRAPAHRARASCPRRALGLRSCACLAGATGPLLALLSAVLATSSPAEEAPPPVLLAFGGAGGEAGQFHAARGVGLNLSSGDVYVADQANRRVQRFTPWGAFIGMFGAEVNETKDKEAGASEAERDLCTQAEIEAKGVKCKAGVAGAGADQFKSPMGVAVDNGEGSPSRGDVYVVDFGNHRVEKFGPAGEFLLTFGKEVNETKDAEATASEAEKNVCTAASGNRCEAGKAGTGEDEFEWAVGSFIAVGSNGTVYVGDENRIQEFEPSGAHEGQIALPGAGNVTALAVSASSDVYVKSSGLAGVHEYNAAGGQVGEFDPESTSVEALALSPVRDLFVGESSGSRVHIYEYSSSGAQLASFGSEGLGESSASQGIAASAGGTIYVSESSAPYHVVVFGKPPPQEPPLVPPTIDSQSLSDLGITDAVPRAQVNPHFLKSTYYVEYGTTIEYSHEVPAPPGTALGGGEVGTDQPASVILSGLTPGTDYHYRFVAQSENGKGESRTTDGPDQTFRTFPSGGLSGLPDGRVYEQVSPLEANGNEAGAATQGSEVHAQYGIASADGNHVLYSQRGPFGETHSGNDLFSVSTRGPRSGWDTSAAVPPGCGYNASNFFGAEPRSLLPAADLSRLVFAALGGFGAGNCPEPSTYKGDPLAYNGGLYRTEVGAGAPEWWLTKPTVEAPTPNPTTTGVPIATGGSPDLNTVYFTYFGTLVPEDRSRAAHVTEYAATSAFGFYEWKAKGGLHSAAGLPNEPGEPAKGEADPYGAVPAATLTRLNDPQPTPDEFDNEVSRDGRTAFFVSPDPVFAFAQGAPTPVELYVRDQGEGETADTVLVSRDQREVEEGTSEEGKPKPAPGAAPAPHNPSEEALVPVNGYLSSYVFASPDGSRAFFASRDRLTKQAPEGGVKEYEFNTGTNELRYLEKFAEPASGPFSSILASSEDGSSFVFDNTAEHKLELWERLPDGEETVTEIAAFSGPSSPSFEARAAKDGEGTAFVLRTDAVLSGGFDNEAATEQVYRYVAGGKLTCVSCAPAGTAQSDAQAFGWSRVIGDGGARIFFASAEQLLARAGNGVANVYEWEQAGTGSCHSGEREGGCLFLISSGTSPNPSFLTDNDEKGENVFFATSQGLVKGDSGEIYALYDARVNGGFPEEPPPAECAGSCRPASPAPPLAAPLTTALGPSGNLAPLPEGTSPPAPAPKPLTRAQKLARALKACKKKPKKKRVSCEKQAEKRYGVHVKARKTSGSRRGKR